MRPLLYLAPFLEVVRAPEAPAAITAAALSAVHKLLSAGLLTAGGVGAAEAARAVVRCTCCRRDHRGLLLVWAYFRNISRPATAPPPSRAITDATTLPPFSAGGRGARLPIRAGGP